MKQPLILIAESNREMLALLERYFHFRGCQVEAALGGPECLSKLTVLRPDALILDEELPRGGGARVLATMRDDDNVPFTPTVLLCQPPAPLDADYESVVGRLEKPFRLFELSDQACKAMQMPAGSV